MQYMSPRELEEEAGRRYDSGRFRKVSGSRRLYDGSFADARNEERRDSGRCVNQLPVIFDDEE